MNELTTFLSLKDSDSLHETLACLLKYSNKHTEFTKRLLELKRLKMRKNVVVGSTPSKQSAKKQ